MISRLAKKKSNISWMMTVIIRSYTVVGEKDPAKVSSSLTQTNKKIRIRLGIRMIVLLVFLAIVDLWTKSPPGTITEEDLLNLLFVKFGRSSMSTVSTILLQAPSGNNVCRLLSSDRSIASIATGCLTVKSNRRVD
jgi:hypothetical protein